MKLSLSTLILAFLIIQTTGISGVKAQMSVMSYNIRYDNPGDAPNNWDNRKEKVANLIQFYEPAFVGIQEALLHQLEDLDHSLATYHWIGRGRKDGNKKGEFSAILFDTTKVRLVAGSDSTIWLSKTPQIPGKDWDAAFPRILTWGKFVIKSTGRPLFVFNTHFDHIGDTARTKSARLILKTIRKMAEDIPVILTGDFNSTPQSQPYTILTSSFLTDAYHSSAIHNVGPDFTFSGFTVNGVSSSGSQTQRIDYIFTNEHVQVRKHAIISSFKDGFYPSDHLPVVAEVALK